MSEDKVKTPEIATPEISKEVEKVEEKLLTQDQFDKALKDRLERERNKILKETEVRIKEVQAESERLAKLSAEEKEKELTAKNSEEVRIREANIATRENRLDAIELFANAKVPTELVTYVISADKERTIESSETFIKTFNESVAKAVAEQLKGTPPKDISVNSESPRPKIVKAF